VQLARLPGSRENRWAHLLSGAPKSTGETTPAVDAPVDELAALKAQVARLDSEVAALKALVARIAGEPGTR
jgi:hypothetical protein